MARPVVLVVDDDPGVRESFRLILEDHYDVIDVPDGPGALDVVRASQVDLVLLDIRLPGMDGIEVLERIKGLDEGVEVILVTAVKTVRTAVAAMKLGAFDYLTKPFEEDELLSLSRRALERRALEREVAFLCIRGRSHASTSPGGAWRGRNVREGAFMAFMSLTLYLAGSVPPDYMLTSDVGMGRLLVALLATVWVALLPLAGARVAAQGGRSDAPAGQLTWALHVTITPAWFDPADHTAGITAMIPFYAIHDALVKPMPGNPMSPSLAESWSASRDGLTYEFVLRRGVKFHNGDVMTAEDVKFSFERYRGVAAKLLREKIAAVEIADPDRVRFRLKEPWPDFLAFYATPATGAAWIVPRKYVEKVGDEGFKKMPVGAGPYRLVSFNPGVDMVLEAHEGYWRKTPGVKRLVLRVVPDESTRLAMLKRGEVDIAYALRGPLADEVRRTPGLKLASTTTAGVFWLDFTAEQWDPKSPWHDRRARLAASLAIDRRAISQATTLGFSKVSASVIPSAFDFAWPAPPIPYDPDRSRRLLAEAGHPGGFDASDYNCDASFTDLAEAVVNNLKAVGIRARIRPLERAAFLTQWREKKLRHLMQGADGVFGNAATRIERNMVSRGPYAFGSYPEIDDLAAQQARETDRKKRETLLHQIQKIAYERVMFAPIWEFAGLQGVGPRVEEPGLGLIELMPFSAPYEDVRLKGK